MDVSGDEFVFASCEVAEESVRQLDVVDFEAELQQLARKMSSVVSG